MGYVARIPYLGLPNKSCVLNLLLVALFIVFSKIKVF
jgi:hypothetical protein